MDKPINFYFEDTPETRELMEKAFEEHMKVFKSPSFYSYPQKDKKDSNV